MLSLFEKPRMVVSRASVYCLNSYILPEIATELHTGLFTTFFSFEYLTLLFWLYSAFMNRLLSKRICKNWICRASFCFSADFLRYCTAWDISDNSLSTAAFEQRVGPKYMALKEKKDLILKMCWIPYSVILTKSLVLMLISFVFFAHLIFAQKIKICWNIPVLSKNHSLLIHTNGSHCVFPCRRRLAFSTFFQVLVNAKQT